MKYGIYKPYAPLAAFVSTVYLRLFKYVENEKLFTLYKDHEYR